MARLLRVLAFLDATDVAPGATNHTRPTLDFLLHTWVCVLVLELAAAVADAAAVWYNVSQDKPCNQIDYGL